MSLSIVSHWFVCISCTISEELVPLIYSLKFKRNAQKIISGKEAKTIDKRKEAKQRTRKEHIQYIEEGKK